MPDLAIEQTKRCQNCHIESQPTTSTDKDTKCHDLKRINWYDTPNSHWPFVDAKSNGVEVGRSRRDLIPKHHRHQHLIDNTRNQTLDQQGLTNQTKTTRENGLGPRSFVHQRHRRLGERKGSEAILWEAVAGRRCRLIFFCMKRKIVLFSISAYLVKLKMAYITELPWYITWWGDITFLYSFKNDNALLRASIGLDAMIPSPQRSFPSSPATLASTVLTRHGHHTLFIITAFLQRRGAAHWHCTPYAMPRAPHPVCHGLSPAQGRLSQALHLPAAAFCSVGSLAMDVALAHLLHPTHSAPVSISTLALSSACWQASIRLSNK
jgi:hypothetical protein